MSTTDETNKVSSAGAGAGTEDFSFPYPINVAEDLTVEVVTEATGVPVVQTLTTHYTVAIDASTGFATVTMLTAPTTAQWLTIRRSSPMSQESTYRSHTSIEGDLDTSVFRDMSQQEQIDRCIKMQSNDNVAYTGGVVFDPTLPSTRLATGGDTLLLKTDKTGLEFSGTGSTVVSAGANITTQAVVIGDDGAKGVKESVVTIADTSGNMASVGTLNTHTIPAGTDTLVGKSTTDTLTNKTIDQDGTGNSITNIANASIKASAAIAVNKLAALTASELMVTDASGFATTSTGVSATEASYLNGVTSAIQTQVDAKGVGDVTLTGTQTLTNKTLTSPRVGTALLDTSGNEWISVFAPATAVNNIEVVNAVSTGNPEIRAVGDDAVVDLDIKPKSTGRVNISQPTLSDAILGTPTSGTLTNADGYLGDSSLVTTGALNSGSITSGFGNIDTGSSTITTTGKVTAPLVQSGGVTLATTATKAPALGDEGGYFVLSDGSAVAVTIPANASVAFAVGTEIHFEQGGAGAITVGITSDTLNVNSNLTKVTNGQYSVCTIKKTSATTWTIFGNLVAA